MKAGLGRNLQFQLCLEDKEERLKKERKDYEKAYEMKLNWIRSKVAELNAEKSETEKGLEYRHDIEEFVVRVFELLKKAQGNSDALAFQWRGLKYDLSHAGVEEMTKPTLAEGILMDILRTAETGTTVVQDVEAKLVDLGNRARSTTIVDYEDDEKQVPTSHRQEKEKEKGVKPAADMRLKEKKSLQPRSSQRQRKCQSSRKRARKEKIPARLR